MTTWEVAEPTKKRFKLFIEGPPGSFKTRTALRLADNGDRQNPALAVIDTEFGTDHYAGDFAYRRKQTFDPDEIYQEVKKLVKNPGQTRTLLIDTFSIYYDALMEKWVDLFQLREKTSAGNKGDYYTLQPRDYVHINRDAGKLVRMLLKCDLNIICICQQKEKWENMKVVGSVFDGWKRLPYYFDTYLQIQETKEGWKAVVKGKDRSHSFKPGEVIPWVSDAEIVKHMVSKLGQGLAGGDMAAAYDPDTEKQSAATAAKEKVQSAAKTEEKTESKSVAKKETAEKPAEEKAEEKVVEDKSVKSEPAETDDSGKEDTRKVDKDKLMEIVRAKKGAKVNDPTVWGKMLSKYEVETAKEMNMSQADELIKDLVRGEIPT